MSSTESDEHVELSHSEALVEAWRLETLLDAGYTFEQAEHLAANRDVDLHGAVVLVQRGCDPRVAFRILA